MWQAVACGGGGGCEAAGTSAAVCMCCPLTLRFGKGGDFADAYEKSSLAAEARRTLQQLEEQKADVSPELLKELQVSAVALC